MDTLNNLATTKKKRTIKMNRFVENWFKYYDLDLFLLQKKNIMRHAQFKWLPRCNILFQVIQMAESRYRRTSIHNLRNLIFKFAIFPMVTKRITTLFLLSLSIAIPRKPLEHQGKTELSRDVLQHQVIDVKET